MQFISGHEPYRKRVVEIIKNATEVKVSVAFWGHRSTEYFSDTKIPIQMICNLGTGGTNPFEIEKFLKRKNFAIKTNDKLHAKIIWTPTAAIVGSANFSANGLGYEDEEVEGWLEAGIYEDRPEVLKTIERWFDSLWLANGTRKIDDAALEKARRIWSQRRNHAANRPHAQRNNLLEAIRSDPGYFKDKQAYMVIWDGSETTPRTKAKDKNESELLATTIESFEGWPDLPQSSDLLCIEFDGDSIEKISTWKSLPRNYGGGRNRQPCEITSSVLDLKLKKDTDDLKALAKELRKQSGYNYGVYISLFQIARHFSKPAGERVKAISKWFNKNVAT